MPNWELRDKLFCALKNNFKHDDRVLTEVANQLVDVVEAAGWQQTPAGDLRAQLVQLGRTLKAEEFHRDYSDMRDDAELRADEAKAEVKSEIGRAILDALGVE